jgi:hypothetical protein
MAQDAPEVACVDVELLLVGVVVGDCRVVLVVEEPAVVDEPEAPDDVESPEDEEAPEEEAVPEEDELEEVPPVVALVDEPLVLLAALVAVVVLAWCGWAASAANRPTPASEPAATQPVALRVRRNEASRREGVVMTTSRPAVPQRRLSVPATPRYKLLRAR